MKNTGKPSEELFEEYWASFGKEAHVERLVDAAEIRGRTGRIGLARAQPSDYIVTFAGYTMYAEVKSTIDSRVLKPSLLKPKQRSKAVMITAAGGQYDIFVHSLHHERWYRFPFRDFPTKSTPWQNLGAFSCLM